MWRPLPDWLGGEQPYDLNSWQESETALALADTLDEDAVIVEGYAEYATWRPHLAYLRDPYGDPDMEMEIDGVGGVSILAKARVFRSGVHFPAFSFEKHAETEGFGKVIQDILPPFYNQVVADMKTQMAKRMGFSVVGLPHYTVWHLYEPSVDDIRHMEEMKTERENREREEKERAERTKKIKEEFNDPNSQWEKDKTELERISKTDEEAKKKDEEAHKKNEETNAHGAGEKKGDSGPAKQNSDEAVLEEKPKEATKEKHEKESGGKPKEESKEESSGGLKEGSKNNKEATGAGESRESKKEGKGT